MHKTAWKSYAWWAGFVLTVAVVTLIPVIVRSFGARRASSPELLTEYAILVCSIGLGWVLSSTRSGTRNLLTRVLIWLLGATALAVVILITRVSESEAVLLYFAVPILRETHPSRATEPYTGRWVHFALLICADVLLVALYVYFYYTFEVGIRTG